MTPSKFLFAREFPSNGPRVAPIEQKEATLTVSEHRTLLAAAVAGARSEAFIQGRVEAQDEQTARLAEAVEQAAERLSALVGALDEVRAEAAEEAIRFAHLFALKLAGSLLDHAPMPQIESAARAIFDDLRGQPHVAVRVSPELADAAKQALGAIARERGYEGRLIVMGEPEIAPGDVRIEWADGGIVRDRARAEQLLAEGVARALAVRTVS
jgi:flagellar assembly protein FliH